MSSENRQRLLQATEYAYRWHEDQPRKDTEIPYVCHLLQVAGLVLEHGGDADQAIAGLLHDSLEDAPDVAERARRKQRIEEDFGERVLEIVEDCTDTREDESLEDKAPWRERKERYVAHLATASKHSQLVAACDKRHNLHAVVWDVKTQGPGVFERFNSVPAEQVWYFASIIDALRGSIPTRLGSELEHLLQQLRGLVATREA